MNKTYQYFRDILPEEKPQNDHVRWYLEDLLLSYKYGKYTSFCRDIKALKNHLDEQAIRILEDLADTAITFKASRKENFNGW